MYKEDIFDKDDNMFFDETFEKYKIDKQAKAEFFRYLTVSLDRFANGYYLNFEENQYEELLNNLRASTLEEVYLYVLELSNGKIIIVFTNVEQDYIVGSIAQFQKRN